ncbi:MAG: hypothetical protein IT569_05470 [Leptospiraceae bacterium]|nr:hypothetical protein [Leptospiraceae bacterium]
MKQKSHDLWRKPLQKPETDSLELKKYVDLILQELDGLDKKKPKFVRSPFRKDNSKKDNSEILLRDIPFVF